MSARLSAPATARTRTEPPSPPSPPSGPPLGTYFSRRKLLQPLPPSPPLTKIVTRSRNMARYALTRTLARPQRPGHFILPQGGSSSSSVSSHPMVRIGPLRPLSASFHRFHRPHRIPVWWVSGHHNTST